MATNEPFKNADRSKLAAFSIPIAIVLFLAVNLIAGVAFSSSRIDLTQDHSFTVSDSTRTILGQISEPITVQIYESRALLDAVPQLKIYADRVDELLNTYRQLSNGKLLFEKIDPVAFSPEEDRAIGYQLRGIPLDRSGAQGYFGLVATNTLDGLEVIPFLDPARQDLIEYDLTSLVQRLSHPDLPKIAVIDGLQMFGSVQLQRYPWAILGIINKSYHIDQIDKQPVTLAGDQALLVAHPHNLPPQTLYAIDQYALAGHPVFVFLDPDAENSPPSQTNSAIPAVPASDLGGLLKAWGVDMPTDKVVGDRSMALQVTATAGQQRILTSYLPWLIIRKQNLNPDDPTTSQLQLMRMSSAGALSAIQGATTKFTPLIQTTTQSMLFDAKDVLARPDPVDLLQKFKPGGTSFVLAARVTGSAKTAFPDGPPPPAPPDPNNPSAAAPPPAAPQIKETTAPINIVVVSDTDMLADSHVINDQGQPTTSNSDFVLNVLDNLVGGLELNGLRGRGIVLRTFTTVQAMESAAEATYQATEQKVTQQLQDTQNQLAQLQTQGAQDPGQGGATQAADQSTDQQEAIEKFNRQIVDLRRQLRDLRAASRAQIDALATRVELANIALMPAVVIIIGLIAWFWRRTQLKRYVKRRHLDGRTSA